MILGIDEVGRGPWAGPLVVGAVILGPDFAMLPEYTEITDSKKLTALKRERLAEVIHNYAYATGLGWVSAEELDRCGMARALRVATVRAVQAVGEDYRRRHGETGMAVERIMIDGTVNFLAWTELAERVVTQPKGDLHVKEIGAASIIAKVARDRYMLAAAERYPGYKFEDNVGYGTAAHQAAIKELGPCPEHRFSIRPLMGYTCPKERRALPKPAVQAKNSAGAVAEQAVMKYLVQEKGHKLLAHNYRTKTYEIDIISADGEKVYFTEVKYRQDGEHGLALEQVTPEKLQRMRRAARAFMVKKVVAAQFKDAQPLLAVASVCGDDFKIEWFELEG